MNIQDTQANTTPHNEPPAQDVEVRYRLSSGKYITVEVSPEIEEWLETTDRKIRTQSRYDRRRLSFVEDVDALDMKHRLLQEDTAETVIRNESFRQLFQAMSKLSELRRYRVYLHYFRGLRFKTIADLENVTGNAVSRSIRAACEEMKKYLSRYQ